jgi:hypothetical protein
VIFCGSLPFGSGYQPQFFFGTTDVTSVIHVDSDIRLVQLGEQVDISFELKKPVGVEKASASSSIKLTGPRCLFVTHNIRKKTPAFRIHSKSRRGLQLNNKDYYILLPFKCTEIRC